VSPTDIWAIGSKSVPEDTLLHYNGSTWQQVTASVLSGQGFSAILALPKDNVWAIANTHLVHLSSGKWSRVQAPWTFSIAMPLAPDGSGGFWFIGYSTGRAWAVHRTFAGAWSRTKLAGTPTITDLALVPGTTSLWGAAWTAPGADGIGANAQIVAYGPER
jgi:hypothetical protein